MLSEQITLYLILESLLTFSFEKTEVSLEIKIRTLLIV